jgi:CBS domain containing-hemolysin-like protein
VKNAEGAFTGVVTLEDVLEEIIGREIVDELDPAVDMQEMARRKRWERPVKAEGGKKVAESPEKTL